MPRQPAPISFLIRYIPEAAADLVLGYLNHYRVQLTITRERKTILGDYRYAGPSGPHRISVNGNLNKYSFLITLIHELAHLVAFEKYGPRINSHGTEWKKLYALLLKDFLNPAIFPEDIIAALKASLHNLPASSCSDDVLMRVLNRYDLRKSGTLMIEELAPGAYFELKPGQIFKRGKKLRKRFMCEELSTGKMYLFSPIYEVRAVVGQ